MPGRRPRLDALFADYASYHRSKGNQLTHALGIPMILLGAFALLARVSFGQVGSVTVSGAELLLVGATLFYLSLDRPLAVTMAAVSAVLIAAGRRTPVSAALGLFVLGWILQFVGHAAYEKKAPAFFKNLTHLLVGPLWILAKAVGRA